MRRRPQSASCLWMLITFTHIYLPVVLDGLQRKKINTIDLAKYKEDSKEGVILEVDLQYPQESRNIQNDYPVAPEKIQVTKEMLSSYCESIREKFHISIGQVHELIPTLNKKAKYVLH